MISRLMVEFNSSRELGVQMDRNKSDFYLLCGAKQTSFSADLPIFPFSSDPTAVFAASMPFSCYKYNSILSEYIASSLILCAKQK